MADDHRNSKTRHWCYWGHAFVFDVISAMYMLVNVWLFFSLSWMCCVSRVVACYTWVSLAANFMECGQWLFLSYLILHLLSVIWWCSVRSCGVFVLNFMPALGCRGFRYLFFTNLSKLMAWMQLQVHLTVPGLFVPKTFRSQERIVPMENFSFPRLFVPWNFRSRALSFSGTFVPWTFRSQELSFPGLFVPKNFRSSDYFTRHWLWTQTAIAAVRICFVGVFVLFFSVK